MAASADTSKHVQQTCRSRTSSILGHMCRRPHAMSCDLVIRGFFSSAPSSVSKLPRFHRKPGSSDERFSHHVAPRVNLVAYTIPVVATIDFRTARRQSHVCSRGILKSVTRVFRCLLHDARKSFHGSLRLIVGECLWDFDLRLIDPHHEVLASFHTTMRFHRHMPQHAPLAIIRGVSKHRERASTPRLGLPVAAGV